MKELILLAALITLSACGIQTHTQKPVSDLKTSESIVFTYSNRVVIDSFHVTKIDTALNLFKAESLVGIKVSGSILKQQGKPNQFDYFENICFIEKTDLDGKKISIEIVPNLKTSDKKKRSEKSKVKYTVLDDRTNFEFYLEKKVITTGFGGYVVEFICGDKRENICLIRRK